MTRRRSPTHDPPARLNTVDAAGEVVWQVEGYQVSCCHRLLDGHTLLIDEKTNRLVEVDAAGELVREHAVPVRPSDSAKKT